MSAAQQLLTDALKLSLDERANMARQLLLSLESEPFEEDYEAAWEREISERVKRMDNGDSDTMDWRQAHAEIRAKLREKSMTLHILRDARKEIEETAAWYEDKRPGLGDDFLHELEATYLKIEAHPKRFPRISIATFKQRQFRRIMLRRFPYKVIYEMRTDEEIVVLAVAHGRRRPNYWAQRVSDVSD